MKRHGGNLEGEASQDEDEPNRQPLAAAGGIKQSLRNAFKTRSPGKAINQRRAIQEQARRQGTQHKVFQAGFGRLLIIPMKGRDHVKAEREQFQADIDGHEIIRTQHDQHAKGRE